MFDPYPEPESYKYASVILPFITGVVLIEFINFLSVPTPIGKYSKDTVIGGYSNICFPDPPSKNFKGFLLLFSFFFCFGFDF